ncbi:ubiquinol-cytochrome c reductase 6.4 kDa subunit [Calliopsis andreniformis]|uniref:ubiquinol-cytochrome c reductase 6.4 kDa subunit n=1 Tax=Calliopsis andreniformis TaxID=337506 RepID=UPI003FCDCD14
MRVGKRHLEVVMRWIPSAMIYGGAAGLGLVYFTDWKVIAANIPFYGGKFKQ